ncbi:thioredoxin-like protein [Dipodascopsis tothii]|uniref:thioredoxin-like protein n=1 Tax=Dipodascopsis tothii TaxID=44089 RepID=UPI0034CF5F7A
MRVLGFTTVVLALVAFVCAAGNVIELTDKTFQSLVLKGGKPTLVEFYATWCGHCKNLAPVFEELADNFSSKKDQIQIAKIDGDKYRSVAKKYDIKGFPMLKLFDGKSAEAEDYVGGRNLEGFTQFIVDKTGITPKKPKAVPSDVVMLKDTTFEDVVLKSDAGVLVAFTASWCGHCKKMAPAYETLANVFKNDKDVVIAKMDATDPASKQTPPQYGVGSYPTIKWFAKGAKDAPVEYEQGRSVEDFVAYVNQQAGTHRRPDGSLDASAGLIPKLDALAAKFVEAVREGALDDAHAILTDAKVAAGLTTAGVKEAEYYIKVFEKVLADGEGYLVKESLRLGSILKKGTLAKAKADDFAVRKNILMAFRDGAQRIRDEL